MSVTTPRPATSTAEPIQCPSAGPTTPPQTNPFSEPLLLPSAGGQHQPPAADLQPAPIQGAPPAAGQTPQAATAFPAPIHAAPSGTHPSILALIGDAVEADPAFLALAADLVDDLERTRIANQNRMRHLTGSNADSDDEVRGLGLDERHPYVRRFAGIVAALEAAEHDAVLGLQSLMRKHPLGPWVKSQVGLGEKQTARLLAAIGDPYIRPALTRGDGTVEPPRPRRVSELWALCGLHVLPARQSDDGTQGVIAGGGKTGHPGHPQGEPHTVPAGVAPKRRRGQAANWSTTAKTRCFLVAESCIKQRNSPFRAVYDEGRSKYAGAVHQVACQRCGPSGSPAQPGTPLSAGHQHARAMRLVMKEILKALWAESKRLHELNVEPAVTDQPATAAG